MPSVGNCSVHPQLIALHLVELVAGIGVLPGADHCPANVSLLVKVPPSHFPCKEQSRECGMWAWGTRELGAWAAHQRDFKEQCQGCSWWQFEPTGYLRMAQTNSSNWTVIICNVKVKTQISSISPVNRILCPNTQENGTTYTSYKKKYCACPTFPGITVTPKAPQTRWQSFWTNESKVSHHETSGVLQTPSKECRVPFSIAEMRKLRCSYMWLVPGCRVNFLYKSPSASCYNCPARSKAPSHLSWLPWKWCWGVTEVWPLKWESNSKTHEIPDHEQFSVSDKHWVTGASPLPAFSSA